MARIDDYKDVIKLAYQTEAYWQQSKLQMVKGKHWYDLNVPISTPKGVEYCLDYNTPVLTGDLRWVPVGSLKVGDGLFAFDEFPRDGKNKRRWRSASVVRTTLITRPTYRLKFTDGSGVISSAEHKWLVRTPKGNHLEWVQTDQLSVGRHRMMKLTETWEDPASFEAGYLAATFDGEGWLQQTMKENGGHTARIGFAQRDNAMAAFARQCLTNAGFQWSECHGPSVIAFGVTGRRHELLRLLGSIRPQRLLGAFKPENLGALEAKEYVGISSIEYLGEAEVVALGTSTQTLVVNGFASHNSAPPTAPTLVNDAADHLAGAYPKFKVKPTKDTQKAHEDATRVQFGLNGLYNRLARKFGSRAIHRTLAIHGGWSGMMAARIGLHEDWDYDNPTWQDFYWQPVDPRYLFPDPGSLGEEFVIYRMRRQVGSIRQAFPDWEGMWYEPGTAVSFTGGYIGQRKMPERLPDTTMVDWIEYWDDEVKCFVANGHPVFEGKYGKDILPHMLGINPFIIRASGYGDDTGEPHERFRSMLYYVFHLLELEAKLLVQYKWIIEDTAWPTWLAPESLRDLDITPGTINYVQDADAIKQFKAVREDAVEPKAVVELLAWVQGQIERATYPVILKGQAPNGIRAGYPIAILSTQAKLKFAAPSDALKSMMEELCYKTLAVIANRIDKPVETVEGKFINPEDHDTYWGRIDVELEPSLPADRASELPILEFAVGSLDLPKSVALTELGFENAEELRVERASEDIEGDPRVRQLYAEKLLHEMDPEYAAAVSEILGPGIQQQKMQEMVQTLGMQLQQMQAQMQVFQMMPQYQQMVAQMSQGGAAFPPPNQTPPEAGGMPGPQPPGGVQTGPPNAVPGSAGGTLIGQNLGNPNGQGQGRQEVNPLTALTAIAREMRANRSISDYSAQDEAYGMPQGGGL